jgi:hypothetical protein
MIFLLGFDVKSRRSEEELLITSIIYQTPGGILRISAKIGHFGYEYFIRPVARWIPALTSPFYL